ncbi:hypothetical protein [Oceanobacillus jeddahense]|uniref:hypothetical protein n=1 Tax=Oceanobacillus jeddahense TaxID=1462527 RepID=UPI000595D209|nr:hypothetical protein [Oceanobacillus jeddahense]
MFIGKAFFYDLILCEKSPSCANKALPKYVPAKTNTATMATFQDVLRKSTRRLATEIPATVKIGVVIAAMLSG